MRRIMYKKVKQEITKYVCHGSKAKDIWWNYAAVKSSIIHLEPAEDKMPLWQDESKQEDDWVKVYLY